MKTQKEPKGRLPRYIRSLKDYIRQNRRTFVLYSVLRVLIIITLITSLLSENFESAAICVLALVLFLLPAFVEKRMGVEIPAMFQAIIFLFIFAAEILGEVNHFFVRIPGWDTMLHTLNGFLCAAVGFSLIELLNDSTDKIHLSPFYLTLVAFCFSMTIGVLWEFFECVMDVFFRQDMQKDFLVKAFSSVMIDPASAGARVRLADITRTVIETGSGQYVVEGGYLDIGLLDTMKDLFVNFVGAAVFSVIGYLHLKTKKDDNALTRGLMLHKAAPADGDEAPEEEKEAVTADGK